MVDAADVGGSLDLMPLIYSYRNSINEEMAKTPRTAFPGCVEDLAMKDASPVSHGTQPPQFLSLGLIVLDELHFTDRESLYNVTGGSGAYGMSFVLTCWWRVGNESY